MPLISSNARKAALLLPLSIALTACDGDNSSSTEDSVDSNAINADSTPPTITSTSPAGGAVGIARDSAITATFSEDMFAKSIDSSSFTLSGNREVSGAVSFDPRNNEVTLEPDNDLAFLRTYTATLSTAITDLSGNALANNHTWSFTTSDGAWSTAELIENHPGNASALQIAVDSAGNALAVWLQWDGEIDNIWANRFDGTSWGIAELIESNDAGSARNPQIAIDISGNALVVWSQYDGSGYDIWANRFDGQTWGTAELIENEAGPAVDPQIAFDASGNALAVWEQYDGSQYSIVANRFDGNSWGTVELIESNDSAGAGGVQIAVDDAGNAFAVWHQRDGIWESIWANRFDGSRWGTAELIESDNNGRALDPQIAVDGAGNALAVWKQFDGSHDNIVANRFDGTTWGTAELIESGDGEAESPQVAFDDAGNALAVWRQEDDGSGRNIVANRFDGSTWGTAELIESEPGTAYSPQIAVDDAGRGLAVWRQHDGSRDNIVANRFDGSSWGTAELIENNDAGYASEPQVVIDGTGNAFAVWIQNDGATNNVVANRFE